GSRDRQESSDEAMSVLQPLSTWRSRVLQEAGERLAVALADRLGSMMSAATHQLLARAPYAIDSVSAAAEDPSIEPLVVATMHQCVVVRIHADEIGRLADGNAAENAEGSQSAVVRTIEEAASRGRCGWPDESVARA